MHTTALRGAVVLELTVALATAFLSVYFSLRHVAQDGGWATVHDYQVAVFADHVGHELEDVERPGMQTFIPWFQEVFILDRRPVEYIMAGDTRQDANHVPVLVVRGREGTCFSFERVEVLYALASGSGTNALLDSGPRDGFTRGIVDAYARGALRAAFGRLTPSEVVLPDAKQAATLAAKQDLALSLERHGLRVLELSVSKPKFSVKYEQTIRRREVADQDVFKINVERTQMLAGRAAILEHVRGQKALELERMRETLGSAIQKARRDEELARYKADRLSSDRLQAAHLALDKVKAQARAQREAVVRATTALRDATQQLRAQQESELTQRRDELELHQAVQQAQRRRALADAEREAARAQGAAEATRLTTLLEAQLQLESLQREARVLREVAQLDAQAFRAQTEAFVTDGVLAVRAALVEKLTGISIEIAPSRIPETPELVQPSSF